MSFLNSTEPLGLPKGSVRAIVALMVNATGCFLFATQAPISEQLVALLMLVDGAYFLTRAATWGDAGGPTEPELPIPFVGDEN